MSKTLNYLHKTYPNTKILITENGYAGDKEFKDVKRIRFIISYLREALKITYESKIDLLGYLLWTAIDDFEWGGGYTIQFGLFHVNFTEPQRTRTSRDSASVYAQMGADKLVPSLNSLDLTKEYERKIF